jgi:hypothetical protein
MRSILFVSAPKHGGWWCVKTYKTERHALDAVRSIFKNETWLPSFCVRDQVKIVTGGSVSYYDAGLNVNDSITKKTRKGYNMKTKIELFKQVFKQYQKAYKEGLVGVDKDRLHIDNATFNDLFAKQRVEKKISGEYLWKQGEKEGITFISLFPLKDLINVNELGEKF